MIFTDVLTASDMNPMYYKFIPIFIKAWKKLFPEIKIHIILITNEIIEELKPYSEYLKIFPPIEGIPTAFIAQNIRLFYPCLLKDAKGGILITDMDIVPLNTHYYEESIKNISATKFVCYRQLECVGKDEMVICYNIAHSNVWKEIFNINSIDDIIKILNNNYQNSKYIGHSNIPYWISDQLYIHEKTQEWNNKTNNLVILNDNITKYNRLDRGRFPPQPQLINNVKNKFYSDYHMYRPYEEYKKINDFVIDLL
tara:strand:+ start:489 stop:1250 length:762 start_codon:yes stop_codon:yes gene_type:complete